jgi:hypothetical protein
LSLPVKPHSVVVGGATVRGYIEPMAPGEAFKAFGVAFVNPCRLYIDLPDAGRFADGVSVAFGSESFVVVGNPELFRAGDSSDHAIAYMRGA